jgi:asparagine synthase (glutamine-hydrolysing)
MCGIAGKLSCYPINDNKQAILASLAHRGPDSQSFWSERGITLFHSRLSILDPNERSNQPMIDYSGRYVLVFNGEIYNYRQLKVQLDYPWKTSSDSEVLLAWLIKYGTSKLDYLEGMFAFAFYDTKLKSCILARDRFGKKPLYIHEKEGKLSFASEIRVILEMQPEIRYTSKQQISNWFYWQTIPGNETIIPEIRQLAPGSFLIFREGKTEQAEFRNWQYAEKKKTEIGNEDVIPRLQLLVRNAVTKRLVSDVPFATFLSGGVDSSIITAIASQELKNKLNTFTISFDEDQFSEHKIAAQVAKRHHTNHHELRLKPLDFLAEIDSGLAATDHPSGDGLNTYVLSKYTRKAGFKMALSGIGGDEWFLGYDYFRALDKWKKRSLFGHLKVLSGYLPFPYRKAIELSEVSNSLGAAAYAYQRMLFDRTTISSLLGLPEVNMLPTNPIFPDTMSARSIQEWKYYTQPVLLRDTDQYSMAVGLELRAPFMDQDLVDFALSLIDSQKLGNRSKFLLIEAFKDILPESVYNRRKQGFTLPWNDWMKKDLHNFCYERIKNFEQRLDRKKIVPEWQKFVSGCSQIGWSRWWSIVSLEDYLQRNEIIIS